MKSRKEPLLGELGKGQVTSGSMDLPFPLWLAGQVLQALVGAQERFAVGTVMVHVLQGVYTEWDEAAASDAPQQTQTATGQPGEGAGVVGQLGHDHLAAGRAAHLDRAVIKGDGLLHIHSLYGNCVGIGNRHGLGVVRRWIHALPIWACDEPCGWPRNRCWGHWVVAVDTHCLFIGWGCSGHCRRACSRLVRSWSRHFTFLCLQT